MSLFHDLQEVLASLVSLGQVCSQSFILSTESRTPPGPIDSSPQTNVRVVGPEAVFSEDDNKSAPINPDV